MHGYIRVRGPRTQILGFMVPSTIQIIIFGP